MPWHEKHDRHAAQVPGFSPNNWLEEGEQIVCKNIMERHQDGVINNRQDITCRPYVAGLCIEAIVWDVQLKVPSWRDKPNPHSCRSAPTQPLKWISCCFVMLGWQPARLTLISAKCWGSPSILRMEIQVLFPQNILHLFVSSQEFSFPCFLSSFLIFPGQLWSLFHTIFKIPKVTWSECAHLPLRYSISNSPLHSPHFCTQLSFSGICYPAPHMSLVILYHSSQIISSWSSSFSLYWQHSAGSHFTAVKKDFLISLCY